MRALLLLLWLLPLLASAQTTRVLFIGNSYTYSNDLPGLFTLLAASLGETVETGMVAPGGSTFQGHTNNAATQNAIALGNWDVVVLQEQSQLPSFPPAQVAVDVLPYAALLMEQIRGANPCTRPVLLMTWGRENGDAQNCPSYPPLCTYQGMQQRLRESYLEMAYGNQASCAPVGVVWSAVRTDQPATALYTDGSHPNVTGSFIAASTLFNTIFRRPTTGSMYMPTGLSMAEQQYITQLSSSIVSDSSATWNIGVNDPMAAGDWTMVEPNTVLFANNTAGAIQQEWSFGDGGTSQDVDPLHIYATAGIHTVTLIVADACGRTDTTFLTVDLTDTSTPDRPDTPAMTVFVDGTSLVVHQLDDAGTLALVDAAGHMVAQARLAQGAEQRILLPRSSSGPLIWRIHLDDGRMLTGKIGAH